MKSVFFQGLVRWVFAFIAAAMLIGGVARATGTGAPVKVVYHVGDTAEQASRALLFVHNHLSADPTAQIVVVAQSEGINFLLKGAADKNGIEYEPALRDLMGSKRVQFRICNVSLMSRNVDPNNRVAGVVVVGSGVSEIARLQTEEGYAYIRP